MTPSTLETVLDTKVGFTEWSLLALKAMTSTDESSRSALACSQELRARLTKLELRDDSGLYSQRTRSSPSGELAYTSIVGSVLSEFFSSPADGLKLHWYHQLAVAAGIVDIIATVCSATASYPVAVIEFGWTSKDKWAQCLAYGSNLASTLFGSRTPLLAIMWNVEPQMPCNAQIELQVLGFHPCHAEESRMSAIATWKGEGSEQSIAKLLSTVGLFAQHIMGMQTSRASRSEWSYPSRTVAIERPIAGRAMVHKLYDYRKELRGPPDFQRKHKQMVRFGKKVEYELGGESSDLVVLQYPYIDGEHIAASVQHFVSAIQSVGQLHEEGVVHGDIRASNLVFEGNGSCTLIDFDFAGSTSDRYPKRFVHNQNLNDVVRHTGAQADSLLCFEHDWHALASIMEMHEIHSCDGKATYDWERAIELLRTGKWQSSRELLLVHSSVRVAPTERLKNAVGSQKGTGTPEKGKLRHPCPHRSNSSSSERTKRQRVQ